MNIEQVLSRLKKAVAFLKGQQIIKTQQNIADKLGYNKGSISQALNGVERYLTEPFIRKFCDVFNMINYNWLLTGEGSMLNREVNEPSEQYIPEGKLIKEEEYPTKEVTIIPIKGRGGLENAYFDEVMFNQLEKEMLTIKNHSSNGSKWFKIEVEGISMDDGSKKSLAEGDWAYCRSISKQYWKSKFHSHKYPIFCLFHNDRGIIFKTIKDQDIETGELILSSLHPNKKKFPDFSIKISECSYICNVIKVLSEF